LIPFVAVGNYLTVYQGLNRYSSICTHFSTFLFARLFNYLLLAAFGGEKGKRGFLGTPQTPAKDFVLCTPVE